MARDKDKIYRVRPPPDYANCVIFHMDDKGGCNGVSSGSICSRVSFVRFKINGVRTCLFFFFVSIKSDGSERRIRYAYTRHTRV